ncbi:uncharacterized protein B0I36DRAFT_141211 [Microdochium trichocladiopsis]|uniref:Uncharacterized protein n=1 Tax=Microdochium trichocladiopsis TaxID=1682393 RepID=A0A9P9BND9_9PEZI|nr:uncharacterized protein B0I36DRAFT_141211 [Microdochium trichocladiopsis]KAH7027638.1 hypothetical protein B0I36DRAFT_141211 [Microdochium trichocladiopsis]
MPCRQSPPACPLFAGSRVGSANSVLRTSSARKKLRWRRVRTAWARQDADLWAAALRSTTPSPMREFRSLSHRYMALQFDNGPLPGCAKSEQAYHILGQRGGGCA